VSLRKVGHYDGRHRGNAELEGDDWPGRSQAEVVTALVQADSAYRTPK
jgi:hypothetical protein